MSLAGLPNTKCATLKSTPRGEADILGLKHQLFLSSPVPDHSSSSHPLPAGVPPPLCVDGPSLQCASSPLVHAGAARAPAASSSLVHGAVAEGGGDKDVSECLKGKKLKSASEHLTSSSRRLCSFCCSMRFCLSASSCRLYSSCSRSCCSWRSCWRRSASDRSLFSCCRRMKSRRSVDSPGTLTMELDSGSKKGD